jgi:general secretion pathway protein K
MTKHRRWRRQRGVAVVTALLLTTLAITIVASLFWQQQVQVRSIENQRLQLQKQWILRGALDWASLILRADATTSSVDHLGEPWAVPLAETRLDEYVENGRSDADASDATLSGGIIDAQSRYNLNNLASGGTVNPVEVATFQRLLGLLQLNPALAQATADAVAAGQTKPTSGGASAVSTGSNLNDAQSGSRPMAFEYVQDLLAVPGFNVEMVNKLKDYVTILPGTTPVNVNTASPEVLAAQIDKLSLTDAAALTAGRDSGVYFRSVSDFSSQLASRTSASTPTNVSVVTNYFLVNGKVRLSRAAMDMQALIERTSNRSTKVIWIRED